MFVSPATSAAADVPRHALVQSFVLCPTRQVERESSSSSHLQLWRLLFGVALVFLLWWAFDRWNKKKNKKQQLEEENPLGGSNNSSKTSGDDDDHDDHEALFLRRSPQLVGVPRYPVQPYYRPYPYPDPYVPRTYPYPEPAVTTEAAVAAEEAAVVNAEVAAAGVPEVVGSICTTVISPIFPVGEKWCIKHEILANEYLIATMRTDGIFVRPRVERPGVAAYLRLRFPAEFFEVGRPFVPVAMWLEHNATQIFLTLVDVNNLRAYHPIARYFVRADETTVPHIRLVGAVPYTSLLELVVGGRIVAIPEAALWQAAIPI